MLYAPKTRAPAPSPAPKGQSLDSPLEDVSHPNFLGPTEPLLEKVPRSPELREVTARGTRTASTSLPFADWIQRAFGHHDIRHIRAHQGRDAARSADGVEASAYTTGHHVVFAQKPDLWTAAHEAAHVIQQERSPSLSGNVGREGDVHERHAEAVAQRVSTGGSAESLLDQAPGLASPVPMVQRVKKTQDDSFESLQKDMRSLRQHPFQRLHEMQDQVSTLVQGRTLGVYDHRRDIVERWYHRLQAERHRRYELRDSLYTRIVRKNQVGAKTARAGKVYRSVTSLPKRLRVPLRPEGAGTTDMSALYSFMRKYGGAGLQGAHRRTPGRAGFMHKAINKMAEERGPNESFSVVTLDPSRLEPENILDLSQPQVRNEFSSQYGDRPKKPEQKRKPQNFMRMYDEHRREGVVAIKDQIPLDAIEALVSTRGGLTLEQAKALEKMALDSTFASEHEEYHSHQPRKDDRDPSGGGGSRGVAVS